MDKGASRYEGASSSEEREMQSDWKIRKLRAEFEEMEQARNDELAKEVKVKEARSKEAGVKKAKDRGAGGRHTRPKNRVAGEETRQRRDYPEEESDGGITGESGIFSPTKRGKVAEQNRAFKRKVDSCLLYTSPSPRDRQKSRMPSSA